MAESKVEQLARETEKELALIKKDVEALQEDIDQANLTQMRERLSVLEDRSVKLAALVEELKPTKAEAEEMGAVKSRLTQLEKREEESGKRGWQFVFIAAGAGLALLSSFLVQLVFYFIKK